MRRYSFPWWAVLLPASSVGVFEYVRHSVWEKFLTSAQGNLVSSIIVAAAAAVYVVWVAGSIRQAEESLSSAREETAVLRERDRIARDMHDNVSQALFYMGVHLGDIQQRLAEGETEEARTRLEEVRQNLDRTYERVRSAIADLRQHPARPRTLAAALTTLNGELERQFQLNLAIEQPVPEVTLSESTLSHVLGVIQEALANTAKHAGVKSASVSLRQIGPTLEVLISDTGRGFDPHQGSAGFGLLMMQERAELISGRLKIVSAPGRGTRIQLDVPLEGDGDASRPGRR